MHFHIGFVKNWRLAAQSLLDWRRVKITFDQIMLLLAGLSAGCERSRPEILPENPAQTTVGASAALAQNSAAPAPPAVVNAAPPASAVVAKEVAPASSARQGAPAGSAAKEKACAPGGCAPGKCG